MVRKKSITPKNFTPTIGAYSHALDVELSDARMIFVTGQIAMDENGEVVSEDIGVQTEYVFERIKTILEECGASYQDVVKAQIFLVDMKDFPVVSPIRNKYFSDAKPVSTLVEVSALAKQGCKIEIEVTAIKGK